MKKIIVMFFILSFSTYAFAEGLQTLIKVGKDMAEMSKALDDETKNFENVRRAIDKGILKPGKPKSSIRQEYGAPVVEFPKEAHSKETWVYKPASSSFFEGIKIYLIFDDNGNLEETKIVNLEKQPK